MGTGSAICAGYNGIKKNPAQPRKAIDQLSKAVWHLSHLGRIGARVMSYAPHGILQRGIEFTRLQYFWVRPAMHATEIWGKLTDWSEVTNAKDLQEMGWKGATQATALTFKVAFVGGNLMVLANYLRPMDMTNWLSGKFLKVARWTLVPMWTLEGREIFAGDHKDSAELQKRAAIFMTGALADGTIYFNLLGPGPFKKLIGHAAGFASSGIALHQAMHHEKFTGVWEKVTKAWRQS